MAICSRDMDSGRFSYFSACHTEHVTKYFSIYSEVKMRAFTKINDTVSLLTQHKQNFIIIKSAILGTPMHTN